MRIKIFLKNQKDSVQQFILGFAVNNRLCQNNYINKKANPLNCTNYSINKNLMKNKLGISL